MSLPPRYRDILLADIEPGEAYRQCLEALGEDRLDLDYRVTETIAYATEVRYAIGILKHGRPERIWNFGDLRGDAERRLWAVLDALETRRIAFVGSGPYPVTALLLRARYPEAEITCIDNNIAAHLLGQAVLDTLGANATSRLAEAIAVDYGPFTAVVIAAMVSGKQAVVEKIVTTSDALVVVRGRVSVHHARVIQFPSSFDDDGALSAREDEAVLRGGGAARA
jgi:hypothetical protein